MAVAGYEIVDSYPLQVPVYEKYEHERQGYPYQSSEGPWLAVYFVTSADLETISEWRGADVLAVDVFQCPRSAPHEYSFDLGVVFQTTEDERKRFVARQADRLYKIYVPVDLAETIERSPFLHWPAERTLVSKEIQANGLCVTMSGGSMIGTGLESNTVRLPVAIASNPLRIVATSTSTGLN